MHKLLKAIQNEFSSFARLTKNGEIKVNLEKLTAVNFFAVTAICEAHSASVEVKRSGKGLVLIFKPL